MTSLLAVVGVVAAVTVTPGPNNFIVLSVAKRYGGAAVRPYIGSILLGGQLLLALTWLGAYLILQERPQLQSVILLVGVAYLVWMGLGMIAAAIKPRNRQTSSPPTRPALQTLSGLVLFQLINPKAWLLAMTATAAVSREFSGFAGFGLLSAIFLSTSTGCLVLWSVLGAQIGKRLGKDRENREFDIALGFLLIISAAFLAFELI